MKISLLPSIILCFTLTDAFSNWSERMSNDNKDGDGYLRENEMKRTPERPDVFYHTVSFPKKEKTWPEKNAKMKFLTQMLTKPKLGNENDIQKRRWYHLESRFPLPARRKFPEVDWRGFNEDVFHESFGDFTPMKRDSSV